jgi:hypothetical protein
VTATVLAEGKVAVEQVRRRATATAKAKAKAKCGGSSLRSE